MLRGRMETTLTSSMLIALGAIFWKLTRVVADVAVNCQVK